MPGPPFLLYLVEGALPCIQEMPGESVSKQCLGMMGALAAVLGLFCSFIFIILGGLAGGRWGWELGVSVSIIKFSKYVSVQPRVFFSFSISRY